MKTETLLLLGVVAYLVYKYKSSSGFYVGNIGPNPPATSSGTPSGTVNWPTLGTGTPGSSSDCPPGTVFNPYNYNINTDTFFNTCDQIPAIPL